MKARKTHMFIELTEIGFGCGSIGGLYRAVSDEQTMNVLDRAWEQGVRYFDVAPFYWHGLAELRLGKYLRTKNRDDYVLSTKVGKLLFPVSADQVPDYNFVNPLPNGVRFDYSGYGILQSCEDSLNRMGIEPFDILYVHDLEPKCHSNTEYQEHMSQFLNDGFDALARLKTDGKIRAFGLGDNQVEPCVEILSQRPLDIILLAGRYTLIDRSAEGELLALCERNKTDLVIGGVFNSGILATGAVEGTQFDYENASQRMLERVSKLEAGLFSQGVNLAQAALHFPLTNPLVKSVLIGTATTSILDRNLESYSQALPRSAFSIEDTIN